MFASVMAGKSLETFLAEMWRRIPPDRVIRFFIGVFITLRSQESLFSWIFSSKNASLHNHNNRQSQWAFQKWEMQFQTH